MRNILITGIAGFIGSATAAELIARGFNVFGIDNFNDYYDPKIKLKRAMKLEEKGAIILKSDLIDDGYGLFMEENKIEAVIHIAASAGVRPSIENPDLFVRNNVLVTTVLLENMKKLKIKNLVFASSSSVYGNLISDKDKSISESDIQNKIFSPYAATKLACEAMIDTYSNLYGISAFSMRYFTVFGPDQRPDLAIIKFMRGMMEERTIDKYGAGKTFRDYTYISDVVEANISALEYNFDAEAANNKINISSNNPISLNELISFEADLVGKTPVINQMDMQIGDVYGTYGDNSFAKDILGWEPRVSFEEGLEKTYAWLKREL